MEHESISIEVVNPQAQGIYACTCFHWVTVGLFEEDFQEFGVFNQDLFAMADWLKIALECTATYWQNLYCVLLSNGFDLILCDGKFTKIIWVKRHTF